jgi:hypothetical protein
MDDDCNSGEGQNCAEPSKIGKCAVGTPKLSLIGHSESIPEPYRDNAARRQILDVHLNLAPALLSAQLCSLSDEQASARNANLSLGRPPLLPSPQTPSRSDLEDE